MVLKSCSVGLLPAAASFRARAKPVSVPPSKPNFFNRKDSAASSRTLAGTPSAVRVSSSEWCLAVDIASLWGWWVFVVFFFLLAKRESFFDAPF